MDQLTAALTHIITISWPLYLWVIVGLATYGAAFLAGSRRKGRV